MKTLSNMVQEDNMRAPLTEKQKGIESHKTIASHLLVAAASHLKAAIHLKEGEYEKAAQCAMSAKEYLELASKARRESTNHLPDLYI
jgi:hypothetical protein